MAIALASSIVDRILSLLLWSYAPKYYSISMIDDWSNKLFKTRSVAFRLGFPAPHLYFFRNFQSSDTAQHPDRARLPQGRVPPQNTIIYRSRYRSRQLRGIFLQRQSGIFGRQTKVRNGLAWGFHFPLDLAAAQTTPVAMVAPSING